MIKSICKPGGMLWTRAEGVRCRDRGRPWPACSLLVLACLAGMAQASPRPTLYHVSPVDPSMNGTTLESVNASGVAAGSQAGLKDTGVVWDGGVQRALGCDHEPNPDAAAHSINDAGQVVGRCGLDDGLTVAVVWDSDGNWTVITDNTTPADFAWAINNKGQVTINMGNTAGIWYGGGVVGAIPGLGGTRNYGLAISDDGWVVGRAQVTGDTAYHAFAFKRGRTEDLHWPGDDSIATGVNVRGHVVGGAFIGGKSEFDEHAIFDNRKIVQDLGNLGHRGAGALGINRFDQVVGFSRYKGGGSSTHGFIYTHDHMVDLNKLLDASSKPGWTILVANAINDTGVIVGLGVYNGAYAPVYLTPVH
jgi:probable HAF family extracellular repeat protein